MHKICISQCNLETFLDLQEDGLCSNVSMVAQGAQEFGSFLQVLQNIQPHAGTPKFSSILSFNTLPFRYFSPSEFPNYDLLWKERDGYPYENLQPDTCTTRIQPNSGHKVIFVA